MIDQTPNSTAFVPPSRLCSSHRCIAWPAVAGSAGSWGERPDASHSHTPAAAAACRGGSAGQLFQQGRCYCCPVQGARLNSYSAPVQRAEPRRPGQYAASKNGWVSIVVVWGAGRANRTGPAAMRSVSDQKRARGRRERGKGRDEREKTDRRQGCGTRRLIWGRGVEAKKNGGAGWPAAAQRSPTASCERTPAGHPSALSAGNQWENLAGRQGWLPTSACARSCRS